VIRDTLFISHATPEDNEFAIWLASRLEMLGYKTWLDKNRLLGGETFWQDIQNVIKNTVAKVLLVYSKNICYANGDLKVGINKEIQYAESIARSKNIKDFIIPLHIDKNASYDEFIGANILTHIPFYENWASGLSQLKEKLEQSFIVKSNEAQKSSFADWYENKYISDCSIIERKECLYSSWWKISELPSEIYMYIFQNSSIAERVKEINMDIPVAVITNVVVSFEEKLNLTDNYELGNFIIKPEKVFCFSMNDIALGISSNSFPAWKDIKNHFVHLLDSIMTRLLLNKGLLPYQLSNGIAYFLPKGNGFSKIKFVYPYTEIKKGKTIGGSYLDIGYWHYAISTRSILTPVLGFSIKPHVIFTYDGQQIIPDEKKQHSYRRNKCKRYFNDVWRNLQLAFIQNLKDSMGSIHIKIKLDGSILKMDNWPVIFSSNFGYIDPQNTKPMEEPIDHDRNSFIIDEENEEIADE
jgi:hypothetical protein